MRRRERPTGSGEAAVSPLYTESGTENPYCPSRLMWSNISGESHSDILRFEWEVAQAEGGSAAPDPSFARRGEGVPELRGSFKVHTATT